jgi:hypothetical protein
LDFGNDSVDSTFVDDLDSARADIERDVPGQTRHPIPFALDIDVEAAFSTPV